jgi:phage gp46-like protein
MEFVFLLLVGLLVLGPLAHLFGTDSRVHDERGWWPDRR